MTSNKLFSSAIKAARTPDPLFIRDSPHRTIEAVDLTGDDDAMGSPIEGSSKSGRRVIGLQSSSSGGGMMSRLSPVSQRGEAGPSRTIRSMKRNEKQFDTGGAFGPNRRVFDRRNHDRLSNRTVIDRNQLMRSQDSPDEGTWKHDKFHGAVRVGSTIFIRHLPPILVGRNPNDGLDQRLAQHFSSVGPVIGVKIERSSMPSALVYFMRSPDAAKAVEQLNGKPLTNGGGNIILKFREKKASSPIKSNDDDYDIPMTNRRIVNTQGSTADEDAWMCDSHASTTRTLNLH